MIGIYGNHAPALAWRGFLIWLIFAPSSVSASSPTDLTTHLLKANLGQKYDNTVDSKRQMLYTYSYIQGEKITAIRVIVKSSDALDHYPVTFAVKQREEILSWKVPLRFVDGFTYNEVSRTLCDLNMEQTPEEKVIYISVSTRSTNRTSFTLMAEPVDDFEISANTSTTPGRREEVSPSKPVYFMYTFPEDVDSVLLKVSSKETRGKALCMTVSVQSVEYPVLDLARNVEYRGVYQTMATQAAIYAKRDELGDRFFIVFVVNPNDNDCEGKDDSFNGQPDRQKEIIFEIKGTIPTSTYWAATLLTVVVFVIIGLTALLLMFCCMKKECCHCSEVPDTQDTSGAANDGESAPTANESAPTADESARTWGMHCQTVFRVSDMAKKNYFKQTKTFRLYAWNLVLIAFFYGLPVVQLVLSYWRKQYHTGNDDLCYYNYACAHPAKNHIRSFNNVFSNIGYVILGIFFLFIVKLRSKQHNVFWESLRQNENSGNSSNEERSAAEKARISETLFGIPQFFGIYYAMGIALISEGFMSSCYHICPTRSNFQFDTSFMYMMVCLCLLQVYQTRHFEVMPNSHVTYVFMACVVFMAFLGVIFNSTWVWVIYALAHIFFSFFLTAKAYCPGKGFQKTFKAFFDCCTLPRSSSNPVSRRDGQFNDLSIEPGRGQAEERAVNWSLVRLWVLNLFNIGWAVFAAIKQPDFATFLLINLIVNLVLYVTFYTLMKFCCCCIKCCCCRGGCETGPCRSDWLWVSGVMSLILTCLVMWIVSFIFFFAHLTEWSNTPAKSRDGNKGCTLGDFYDDHDTWHFLSAISLFLSFLLLLVLDDDTKKKPSKDIPVF